MSNTQQFIEREVITGLIVNDDFIKHIARAYNKARVNIEDCLRSKTAKILAGWCFDYFEKYGQAPKKDIEGIYNQKLQEGLNPEQGSWIEEILDDLSDDYVQKGEEFNPDFLFDRAIQYFQKNQLNTLADRIKSAVENGNVENAFIEQQNFNPITLSDIFEDESTATGDLFDMEIKQPKWLVNELIPTGLTVLGGKSGEGKSYFALNLAMALAQGKWMFSGNGHKGFRGRKGQILYLSLEDGKVRFQKRMREIDPNPNRELLNNNIKVRFAWDKLSRGGLLKIEEWIERMERPKLVVIDVIAEVWDKNPGTGGAGNYAEEKLIFSPISKLTKKYPGLSIILLHHATKSIPARGNIFDTILGGAGVQGSCDNKIVLHSAYNDPEGYRRFSIKGKDIETRHLAFSTSNKGAKWEFLGDAKEAQKNVQRQEIFDLLEQADSPMQVKEIREALKDMESTIKASSVQIILRKMVKDGILEQPKYGFYSLAGSAAKTANKRVADKMRKRQAQVL